MFKEGEKVILIKITKLDEDIFEKYGFKTGDIVTFKGPWNSPYAAKSVYDCIITNEYHELLVSYSDLSSLKPSEIGDWV